jgi:NTE family protein
MIMARELKSERMTGFFIVLKFSSLFFLLVVTCNQAFPQEFQKRPRIGLALSGGGSHGIAHLGVLMVMEEAGLRPDYISGVSMGSIIGGLYAIGYSPDSIRSILEKTDWDLVFTRIIPENKIVFPEKEHHNNSMITLPVSGNKLKLPSGLINGQQVENLLSYYAWPAADIRDFSNLPVSFMCLATDILTGKIVHLKSGYLPDAIRASIAVPTIFTPIKIDSALLIDGGVLRNYAAGEVRQMGADIVIGSYTGFKIYSEDQLQTVTGIVKQIAFLKSLEDFKKQKEFTDVLIEPELKGISSADFDRIDSIITRGYRTALPYKDFFRRLADSIYRIEPRVQEKFILDKQLYKFDRIEILGNKYYSDDQILGVLEIKPGINVSKNMLNEKIDLLYGKTWFEKVKYRIIPRYDSLILAIDCTEESKSVLYGGLYYDSFIRSGIIFRANSKDFLAPSSMIDFDSFIGQYFRARLSLIQFINRNQKTSFAATFYSDKNQLPLSGILNDMGTVTKYNFRTSFSVNKYLGLNQMMKISFRIENSTFIPDFVTSDNLRRVTYNFLSAGYNYQVNTINTKYFPDKGVLLNLTATTTNLLTGIIRTDFAKVKYNKGNQGEFDFNRTYSFSAGFRSYFSPGKKTTISIYTNLLYSIEKDTTALYNVFYLGGLDTFSPESIPGVGFRLNEIPVTKLGGVGADIDINIVKDFHLTLRAAFYAANEFNSIAKTTLLTGYGIEAGYMSVIGPVRLGLMQGLSNNTRNFGSVKGYISVGYTF